MDYEKKWPIALSSTQMTPPDIMGRVRLSSNDPTSVKTLSVSLRPIEYRVQERNRPMASATPERMPETTATNARGNNLGSDPSPAAKTASGKLGACFPNGESQVQKLNTIIAPVNEAAINPAVLFRRAKGSGMRAEGKGRGRERGRGGVNGPNIRPKVEAVVSHQERLKCKVYVSIC